MTLGKNIRKARLAAKLSQTELGMACGWGDDSQTRVSNYELDKREPTLGDLRLISKAVKVSLSQLIEGVDDDSRPARMARRIANLSEEDQQTIENIINRYSGDPGGKGQ